jgi:hypothetical protein
MLRLCDYCLTDGVACLCGPKPAKDEVCFSVRAEDWDPNMLKDLGVSPANQQPPPKPWWESVPYRDVRFNIKKPLKAPNVFLQLNRPTKTSRGDDVYNPPDHLTLTMPGNMVYLTVGHFMHNRDECIEHMRYHLRPPTLGWFEEWVTQANLRREGAINDPGCSSWETTS